MATESNRSARILFVSTYPPTECGLATYTRALITALADLRADTRGLGVARLLQSPDEVISIDPEVATEDAPTASEWPDRVRQAAQAYDLIWVQHEFGIYGPDDGRRVLELLDHPGRPVFTTFHTVLSRPSQRQRRIMDELIESSRRLVVMSRAARESLAATHRVDARRVSVIAHGAHGYVHCGERLRGRPTVATWGLIGPGKGIELGIMAMSRLRHLRPLPRYVICGATHPQVLRQQGEAYRQSLMRLAADLRVTDMIEFQDRYMSDAELGMLISQADIALLPYDSTDQVTSGVLVEAVGAGLPVIATRFPHAVELLSDGAGLTVPHGDSRAIAQAIEIYLTRPRALLIAQMAANRRAAELRWPSVARSHEALARLVTRPARSGAA